MTSTKPGGPSTGLATSGCYAALLRDCDGGPTTKEHCISNGLLKRVGDRFLVEGLPWLTESRWLTKSAMVARVLCERHNNALSVLDDEIGRLHDVLHGAHQGGDVGIHDFDGEDLERWALKVLLGLGASGNLLLNGQRERMETIPELHLRILFGDDEIPEWCGFYYIGGRVPALDADLLSIALAQYPPADREAGTVYGVTVRLLDFQFVTSITQRLQPGPPQLRYRPHGFILGDPERGRIRLRWRHTPSNQVLVLKMREPPKVEPL